MDAFDLTAMLGALASEPRYAELAALIQRCAAKHSMSQDLIQAQDCLSLLAHLGGQHSSGENQSDEANEQWGILSHALLAQAVILYARAVDDSDRARSKKGSVVKAYGTHERRVHKKILELRNKVFAHFGDEREQDWNIDRIVVVHRPNDVWEYRYPFRRVNIRIDPAVELAHLLSLAIPYTSKSLRADENKLDVLLRQAFNSDPKFRALFASNPFNPRAFFQEDIALEFESSEHQEGFTYSRNT